MIAKLKALWANLPHQAQAAIVTFAATAGATLIHAFEDAGISNCLTWSCVGPIARSVFSPHMIATAVFAGLAALKLFYMLPSRSNVAQAPKPGPE